ncbi:MAG: hypothetical protein ACR2GE_13905 [Pseudonocardia sp.]
MASIYPQYQRFATRTSREIPVVIIEPATGAPAASGESSPGVAHPVGTRSTTSGCSAASPRSNVASRPSRALASWAR